MAGTRSSARLNSSPASENTSGGTKRKAEDNESPSSNKSKRGRPSKEQKTLDETLPIANNKSENGDVAIKGTEANSDVDTEANGHGGENVNRVKRNDDVINGTEESNESGKAINDATEAKDDGEKEPQPDKPSAFDEVKADERDEGTTSKTEEVKADGSDTNVEADAIEEDKGRAQVQPSNVLEKGIIYFFTRGRVGITEPESVQELQRSFFVMRPLPDGGKITDGAVQDVGNNRLLALPKKVWPKSGKDRFMVFVEKAGVSMETLKDEFFPGSEYSTKTTGTRQTPEVTPIGEGVYSLVSTQGSPSTTHLAYILTIPSEMGEVQKDVGLAAKGSFVVSAKNPESSGPANAQLPQGPDWPKAFIDEFGGRAWMPAQARYLNYANAQMLLIGEDFDSSANLEPAPKDQKDDSKETPQQELEKLEQEDELRVQNISGDDTVFADLGISSKEYPQVKTTW